MSKAGRLNIRGYILVAIAGIFWGVGGLFVENISAMGVGPGVIAFNSQAFAILPMGLVILLYEEEKNEEIY